MVRDSRDLVGQVLERYATRGVFRSFSELPRRGRTVEFRFLWFRDVPFRIVYDARRSTLTFPDLLPEVTARGEMDRGLRTFIRQRSASSLPDHRRIDLRRVGIRCVNRQGRISLTATIKGRHVEYGVRKAVTLVHEIFMDFLNDSCFTPYLVEHFNLDPDLA